MQKSIAESVLSKKLNSKTGELIYKRAIKMARMSMEGYICEKFRDYFKINVHCKSTRNRNFSRKVPKVRLELTKYGFYFQGVKLFNFLRKLKDKKTL